MTLWQGIYFTNLCAKKVKKYFIKRKIIEKGILIPVDIDEPILSGAKDVYKILFNKPQNPENKRLFTKKPSEITKIFLEGEILKFKYADGVIGCEKADLYLLEQEFSKYEKLKSKDYDWPLALVNDKSKLKSLIKTNPKIINLVDIISELEKLS